MAAFVLFVVAVAGGVVVADLIWENTTAGQITVFHHTVSGYPEGWLLAIAAGLGVVVAFLLVASVNSTKSRRARREQLRRLRHGGKGELAAPEPDRARLMDAFFGPEEPSRHPGDPPRPVDRWVERPESRVDDHQDWVTGERVEYPPEPLYEQARRAAGRHQDWDLPVAASRRRRIGM
jgi:hypothetical protein